MTDRPSRSYKHGRRGRHKHAVSPETKRWEQISGTAWLVGEPAPEGAPKLDHAMIEFPPTRPPERPGWMDEAAYAALLELRGAR